MWVRVEELDRVVPDTPGIERVPHVPAARLQLTVVTSVVRLSPS